MGFPEIAAASQHGLGWGPVTDPAEIGRFLLTILGSILLAAVLGYHPMNRQLTVEDVDLPKTVITYAMVGTIATLIVTPVPALAFVIFGIGGLLRFRTDVGAAKDTGRAILATIIGMACGMGFWLAAIYGTAAAWILFAILEYRVSLRVVVQAVRPENIQEAAAAYGAALRSAGCQVLNVRRQPAKGQVAFVIKTRRGLGLDEIEAQCQAAVPAALQGMIDWPKE